VICGLFTLPVRKRVQGILCVFGFTAWSFLAEPGQVNHANATSGCRCPISDVLPSPPTVIRVVRARLDRVGCVNEWAAPLDTCWEGDYSLSSRGATGVPPIDKESKDA
jgi:hypothetical protein